MRRSESAAAPSSAWGLRLVATLGVLVVVVLVGAALFGDDGIARHDRLRAELSRVERMNEDLAVENRRLTLEGTALRHDVPYIEHAIRDELGWVGKNDLVFIFPDSPEEVR